MYTNDRGTSPYSWKTILYVRVRSLLTCNKEEPSAAEDSLAGWRAIKRKAQQRIIEEGDTVCLCRSSCNLVM